MNQNLLNRVTVQVNRLNSINSALSHYESSLREASAQMDDVLKEQRLLEETTVALQQAKPLLSANSIRQCEELANSALSSIFNIDAKVEWDIESNSFVLNHGTYKTSLLDSEGGGIVSVISYVLQLFLLIKLGKRKFMIFDEAFYAISANYIEAFINFVRQSAHDLGVDILWITHDARIDYSWADSVYLIENGFSKKIQ